MDNTYETAGMSVFVRRSGRPELAGLNIIACCAGYGKTAYLSQLAGDDPESVFVSLAAYDDLPERIGEIFAGGSGNDGTPYERVRRFAEHSRGRLVLIDNADVIHSEGAASLLRLIAESGAVTVFACRTIPSYLIGFAMNGRARIYGIPEMRFTQDETSACVRAVREDASEMFINALYRYTGGWCAGVAQLSSALSGELSEILHDTYLPQYFKCSVLSELDEGLREYLMLSAFMKCGDPDFAREVFRINDGAAKRRTLVKLGVTDVNGVPEIMRDIMTPMLPETVKNEITERAAQYCIANRQFAEAVKLFDAIGNARGAESILKNYGEKLLANCEFELIGYCGDIISKKGRPTDPEVLGALAQYYYYSGEPRRMEEAYNLADSMFGKENKFSVYRKLYNGLMRFEKDPALYTGNVRSALAYLRANSLPLPFLYRKELDTLSLVDGGTEETDTPRLTVIRFGSLTLKADGNEIQCRSRKSAELIAYMLENENRPIPREELLNMLWRGDLPANAVAMLHNLIYGLRRELTAYGLENIIVYKNKCYILNTGLINDADSEIIGICRAADDNDIKTMTAHADRLEKYWGRYLGSTDSLYADERREYYDKCYVSAALAAAEYHRENGAYDRELVLLKNAYALEPYSEQIVRDMLMCFFASGQPDKAKKLYEDYSAAIDEEFGTRPSKWLRNEFLSGFDKDHA